MDRARRGVTPTATASVVPHQAQAANGPAPIVSGDCVEGRRVLGFTCTASSAPTSADDQLLLAGDEYADPRHGGVPTRPTSRAWSAPATVRTSRSAPPAPTGRTTWTPA